MITTVDQADVVIREMGRLDAKKARVERDVDEVIAAAKAQAAERLVEDSPDGRVPLVDYRAKLETALQEYLDENRGTLLDGKSKTLKLNHGSIGYRAAKATLTPLQGTEAQLLERLADLIKPSIAAVLAKLAIADGSLACALLADRVLTVDLSLNKAGLLQDRDQGRVTDEQLQSIGLRVTPAQDRFFATPAKVTLVPPEA